MMKGLTQAFAALAFTACTAAGETLSSEELLIKASALTKVAAAVESAVRYKDAPADLTESQLLELATRHDPGLLEPFKGLVVRARRSGLMTSVLVCTSDGRAALMEDAACTARFDSKLWEMTPPPACSFLIDLAETCKSP